MRGAAYGLVLLCLAGPILGIFLFAASSTAFFPDPDDFRISETNPAEVSIDLRDVAGRLDVSDGPDRSDRPVRKDVLEGLEEIHLQLSGDLRRRPIELAIVEAASGTCHALEVDPEMRRRQYRHYRLKGPLPGVESGSYTLRLVFQDGPAFMEGQEKTRAFTDLVLIARHGLIPSSALVNYPFLKPIPRPVLLTLVALVLFALSAAMLLRFIAPSGSA